ncbi:hypothetical protein GCM10007877_22520 [Marinibactrum halimedae]|uniref:Uncharacterized protein n=1 Tax=Marinibactrum halimedae TaxID=1444977 RepID=A0AA37T660_9GAMM|nr:hypothetical protein GCM10007877_22520 [Marinibactrum halimedae]
MVEGGAVVGFFRIDINDTKPHKTTTPDTNRKRVKPLASIASDPNANRQRTEFPAKASRASVVKSIVFIGKIMNIEEDEGDDIGHLIKVSLVQQVYFECIDDRLNFVCD